VSMTPAQVLKYAQENGAVMVDFKFVDLPGLWHHFSMPASRLDESAFEEGLGFDGSSIRGFQRIEESDMNLVPDPATAVMDPICERPTLSLICNIKDPVTLENYSRDPRYVAQKAEAFLKGTGLGDTSYWGPEAECFILDDVRFDQTANAGYYFIDSEEGIWNAGRDEKPNLGYKPRHKSGYFPVPPMDKQQDLRTEITLAMLKAGVDVELHHHEVATAGQAEFDLRYDTLVRSADKILMYKYVAKNVAVKHGKTVTFMPKPMFGDNGSGMHTHQSIWKGERNVFYDPSGPYAQLSETAMYYIGGLLKHSASILAFAAPTTNSYRRLVPGYEAPVKLAYSQRNRSACVRIPLYSKSEKAKRIEFRPPDPSCNPYLAFAAMLMAGLDGVRNRIHPGEALDKDLYDLPPEEAALVESTPGSLRDVLTALEQDHAYLLEGDVFTPDLIEMWISWKMKNEVEAVDLRPHPYEFFMYFDI